MGSVLDVLRDVVSVIVHAVSLAKKKKFRAPRKPCHRRQLALLFTVLFRRCALLVTGALTKPPDDSGVAPGLVVSTKPTPCTLHHRVPAVSAATAVLQTGLSWTFDSCALACMSTKRGTQWE